MFMCSNLQVVSLLQWNRQEEVSQLYLEHQKMSQEWQDDKKALQMTLETMDETAMADREQVHAMYMYICRCI